MDVVLLNTDNSPKLPKEQPGILKMPLTPTIDNKAISQRLLHFGDVKLDV